MKLTLKKLTITNFKGVKYLCIDFSDKKTKILGRNAVGKTTIADAFCWLLFDKNSIGEKEFNLKPLDEYGEDIHKIITKVEGLFSINDTDLQLSRTWQENWIVHSGDVIEKMEGHIGGYYINDIKVGAKEYKERISSIVKENIFDILTSPYGFANMDWKKRREILFELTNAKDIEKNILYKYDDIVEEIEKKGKDSLKALLRQKINLLNKEKEKLEIRIEETKKDVLTETEIKEKELLLTTRQEAIKKEIEDLQLTIKALEEKIKQENLEYLKYVNKKTSIEREILEIKNKLSLFKKEDTTLKEKEKELLNKELSFVKEEINKLIEEQKKGFEINEEDKICKFCRQPLPIDFVNNKIKEIEQTFYNKIKLEIQKLKNKAEYLQNKINNIQTEINRINNNNNNNEEEKLLLEQLQQKQEELNNLIPVEKKELDLGDIETTRRKLYEKKAKIDTELSLIEEHKNKIEYIKKITKEYNEQCKEILKLKSKLLTIEKLEQDIANTIEEKVNDIFKNDKINIKIKMFNRLINEGLEPACEVLIGNNLVPFGNANRGLQINAGCLIAEALAKQYNIYLPLFVDNAEAVNKITDTNLQTIELYVTTDEKLIINK